MPHIGWSPVAWTRASRADRGPRRERAVLLRPLLRPAAGRPGRLARDGRVRRALRLRRSSAATSSASSSTRRSRAPPACASCATSPGSAPPESDQRHSRETVASGGLILYPAIDIRDGRAVRLMQGDYDRETEYDEDPARRGPSLGRGRRRVAPRRRPRRRPLGRAGEPRARSADRRRGRTCRSSSAAGCATRAPSRPPSMPGSSGSSSARLPCETRSSSTRCSTSTDSGSSSASTPAAGMAAIEGWIETLGRAGAAPDRAPSPTAARSRIVFTPIEVDGTMAGPPLDELARDRRDDLDAELIYSGGDRQPRGPARARGARGSRRSAGRSSAGRSTRAIRRRAKAIEALATGR